MRTLEDFHSRHDEIQTSIQNLRGMLHPRSLKTNSNAQIAYEELCILVEKTKTHFMIVLKGVYSPLLIHEDIRLKKLAWDFIRGEKMLREQIDSYQKNWLKNFDLNYTIEFLAISHELLDVLEYRIKMEQTILLPRLQEKGAFAQAI